MSTPTNDASSRSQSKADNRDYGRDDRLSFRKFAEHKMKREFKEVPLKNFGQCAQDNGLLVVFKCRYFNKKINECMAEHNSPEAFQKYLEENKDELDKRTIKSPEGSIR